MPHAELDAVPDTLAAVDTPLSPDEAAYVAAARAHNTRRGYRSVWTSFTAFCTDHDLTPMPAAPATVSEATPLAPSVGSAWSPTHASTRVLATSVTPASAAPLAWWLAW